MFKFIDLFAGIGGFHQAMKNLGGDCVFASEIDKRAIEVYKENYGINSGINIKDVDEKTLPDFDVLCAGFPCQPFSKAGYRLGFKDATKGTLFFDIVRILEYKKPAYFILENVKNLLGHDKGHTFNVIMQILKDLDYNVTYEIMSPHQLGIPQIRERVYILGVRKDIFDNFLEFKIPNGDKNKKDIYKGIIEDEVDKKYYITEKEERVLTAWDEFYKGIKEKIIGFPIFSEEFGKNYNLNLILEWKRGHSKKSRELYENNKEFIDGWMKKYNNLEDVQKGFRTLEWQAADTIDSLWDSFIQFRPSGIRVKKPTSFPTLVAVVQTPIIGKYKRRLTPREAARLQSFPDTFKLDMIDKEAYKQLGNAVNVKCVEYLASQLFEKKK